MSEHSILLTYLLTYLPTYLLTGQYSGVTTIRIHENGTQSRVIGPPGHNRALPAPQVHHGIHTLKPMLLLGVRKLAPGGNLPSSPNLPLQPPNIVKTTSSNRTSSSLLRPSPPPPSFSVPGDPLSPPSRYSSGFALRVRAVEVPLRG